MDLGYKFTTKKGTGQGNMPSPLLWVATLDTLLTAMVKLGSEFKVQDIEGQTHRVNEVAFADDLQSLEATIKGLQNKADLLSGWCLITGIKIKEEKLRIYGVHWGVGSENSELAFHMDGWSKVNKEIKMDGTMKVLGVKMDMHLTNIIQKNECEETIIMLSDKIRRASARTRDRVMVAGLCIRTNVVYRAQHCGWQLKDYLDLDKKYLGVIREFSFLLRNFPTKLMISNRQDGGLGILSITNAVMERKRKCLLEQGNAGGMIGVAMRSQICRIIRDAGRGGLGMTKKVLWTSVREWGTGLSALVEWLKEVNIRIRVGTGSDKEWEPVEKYESEINKRISLMQGE